MIGAGNRRDIDEVVDGVGDVLGVQHGRMDFVDRLAELEPSLVRAAESSARQTEADRGEDRA